MKRMLPGFALSMTVVSAALLCASCGNGKSGRKATHAVQGKVYWKNQKTPATGALVVFRPTGEIKDGEWPEGFPRGTAGADGSFQLMTYVENDGAPAGEYDVLLQWPFAASKFDEEEERTGEDRLEGSYLEPPRWKKQVKQGNNDPKDFVFIIK